MIPHDGSKRISFGITRGRAGSMSCHSKPAGRTVVGQGCNRSGVRLDMTHHGGRAWDYNLLLQALNGRG